MTEATLATHSPSGITTTVPLISCVMPTYGRPDYLGESIAMFLAQDYPHKELIILNDCPDQHFRCDLPDVRIVNRKTRCPTLGEKRNEAIELAQGEFIAVWDDDDIYLPWRLSYSLAQMQKHESEFYRPAEFLAYWDSGPLHNNQAIRGWVSHAFTMFTKSLWRRAGGYPAKNLHEDKFFFDRVHKTLGKSFITYPIAPIDRFFILRAKSKYKHMCMPGGAQALDLTAGDYWIKPTPIADPDLRAHVDPLLQARQAAQSESKPFISVCIALKNRSRLPVEDTSLELFPNCVRELAKTAEHLKDEGIIELIVVDFQSDDWPLDQWLAEAAGNLRVKVISLDDPFSRGKGMNVAIEHATSERLFLCDADILVRPEAIQRAGEIIDQGKAWFPIFQCLDEQGNPESWYDHSFGMVALHRDLALQAGPMQEFQSWGGEDNLYHQSVSRHVRAVRERSPFLSHQWHPEVSRHTNYALPRFTDYRYYRATQRQSSATRGKLVHRFYACHPHWQGEVHFYANRRFARPGKSFGTYTKQSGKMVLEWDDWGTETLLWNASSQMFCDQEKPFCLKQLPVDCSTHSPRQPLVAIIGLHSSGSSCLAGVLHRLGVYFGKNCGGYYGDQPESSSGFESQQLATILERAMPFPGTDSKGCQGGLCCDLHVLVDQLRSEAALLKTMAAIKYPLLCRAGPSLIRAANKNLRIIHIDRPLNDSIRSLQARESYRYSPEVITQHQRWLHTGKSHLLRRVQDKLTVQFYDLLNNPVEQIGRIAAFLRLKPGADEVSFAADYIDPSRRNV